MLEIDDLRSGYGDTRVLHGVSLSIGAGEVVALLGRNGAGKTTTLRTVMGLLPVGGGTIRYDGKDLTDDPAFERARDGIAYVPETRDIFPSLSVRENLELAVSVGTARGAAWTLERIYTLFPRLRERLDNGGTQLSGGEQQMLAIARGLLLNPRLLVLDEPTEGLAPIVVRDIHDKLAEIKSDTLSILLVEQNFGFATSLADRVYVMGKGQVQWSGTAADIRADTAIQQQWLGV